jgi:hypothetical protein
LTVLDGLPADHEAAVRVWNAANIARLLPPSVDRVARIWEKLAEPEACLVIGSGHETTLGSGDPILQLERQHPDL